MIVIATNPNGTESRFGPLTHQGAEELLQRLQYTGVYQRVQLIYSDDIDVDVSTSEISAA